MSAHVLLNLLNKLGKRDNMGGLASFHNKLNKFNNTGAQMLDYIYQRPINCFEITFFT